MRLLLSSCLLLASLLLCIPEASAQSGTLPPGGGVMVCPKDVCGCTVTVSIEKSNVTCTPEEGTGKEMTITVDIVCDEGSLLGTQFFTCTQNNDQFEITFNGKTWTIGTATGHSGGPRKNWGAVYAAGLCSEVVVTAT